MRRRDFLRLSAAAAGLTAVNALQTAAAEMSRPNILFIATDQQTADALSCTGNPYIKTPALDALAARGIRFTKSFCTSPVCTPSRASWFTSRMPHEIGINANPSAKYKVKFPEEVPSMGKLFQDAGYETAYAGKWHVGETYPGITGRKIPGFDVLPISGDFKKAGGEKGESKSGGLSIDPAVADAAIQFLSKPHDKPFLLTVQILNPHDICEYPLAMDKFPAPSTSAPACANTFATNNEPERLIKIREWFFKQNHTGGWGIEDWARYRSEYYKLTEIADGLIAKVLAALEENGYRENTIVVFTSDHGELMGAHQLTTKSRMYEEAVAVPFIMAGPGISPGGVDSTHLVTGLDILPTILDYAGIAIPTELAGKSLKPVADDRNVPWRTHIVSEFGSSASNWIRMIRTMKYKYIVYADGADPEQFFDCEADPSETKNLIMDNGMKDSIEAHREILRNYIRETKDSFSMPEKGSE